MGRLWQDLRYGVRMLLKQPGFTLVAVLTLALGVGANSAIFSVINTVLLSPLKLKDPDRLVLLYESLPQGSTGTVSYPNLKDWREQNDVFEGIGAYQYASFNLQASDSPERVSGATVSANFFDVLDAQPQLGRTFLGDEDQPGKNRVLILSDQLWRRNFAADPGVAGREIQVSGETYTIVGVMPQGFMFPTRGVDLWVPLVVSPNQQQARGSHFLFTFGRLRPGVTLEQARDQMSAIARRLEEQYPQQQSGRGVFITFLKEQVVGGVRPALWMMMGAVGLVLLIACTNVANLLLARASGRRKEIAIRTALGAGRARLVRQFLTESVLLGLVGGGLGLLLSSWGVTGLVAMSAGYLPRASEIMLDGRVVAFSLILSVLTGVFFGLAPAIQVSKADVQETLKEGGNAGSSAQHNSLRSILVVAELAIALMLLISAGLLIKSFWYLQKTDPGMRPENVITARIPLPPARYSTVQASATFYNELLGKVSSLPGVESAGLVNMLPLQDAGFNGGVQIEGQAPPDPGKEVLVEFRCASPDYFRALGIPLIKGRFFDGRDQEASDRVLIVNQAFVNRLLPGEDPIGKHVRALGPNYGTIVGVVGDVKQWNLTRPTFPEVYVALPQATFTGLVQTMSLVVRTTSDPRTLTSAIRQQVLAVDPAQPVYNVQTMESVVSQSVSEQRLNMMLLSLFAGVALVLALIGIYSVMSYTVAQSTREIGIRMALGAQARDVLGLVVGRGALLAVIGIAIGAALAFALTRLLANMLYGVKPTDLVTFVAVSALLMVVAVLACYVPARRATRVDPMIALRYE